MEQLLSRQIFLEHLARRLETDENQLPFLKLCKELMVQAKTWKQVKGDRESPFNGANAPVPEC